MQVAVYVLQCFMLSILQYSFKAQRNEKKFNSKKKSKIPLLFLFKSAIIYFISQLSIMCNVFLARVTAVYAH
jgi:hypothetical protein